MINLKEFGKEFFSQTSKHRKAKDRLQAKIDDARDKMSILKRSEPTTENVIEPLALAIQKELGAKAYMVSEIGFMSPVHIIWVSEPDMKKCYTKHYMGELEIWIGSYDEEISIVERDKDNGNIYIRIHGRKGAKWLAKYAKQNLKKKRT